MNSASIRFPHLNIEIEHLAEGIRIWGLEIKYYAIIIAIGIYLGLFVVKKEAIRTGQNPEDYLDYLMGSFIISIIGARIYYVMFNWNYYSQNFMEIFNLRAGGIAIYGAVIAGVIYLYFFTRRRNMSFWLMADTACIGLVIGQILGRWGNFFNREAFGGFSDNVFAMQLKLSEVSNTTKELLDNIKVVNGTEYIQVHPTFLYESLWNIGVLIIILLFRKYKQYDGQIFLMYLLGYALGRVWIEQLRTDQLILPIINLPASQCLAAVLIIACTTTMLYMNNKIKRKTQSEKMN